MARRRKRSASKPAAPVQPRSWSWPLMILFVLACAITGLTAMTIVLLLERA